MISHTLIANILWMLIMHCLGDFLLQTNWLATYKQKEMWLKHPEYNPLYEYDYIVALLVHSFIYSVCINILPIIFSLETMPITVMLIVIVSTICHAIIDNLKANMKVISLITDQMLHIVWIVLLAILYEIPMG